MTVNLARLGMWTSALHPRIEADRGAVTKTRKSARILVVDSEAQFLSSVAAILEDQGHAIQLAASGLAAMELLKQHEFDIVLTDIGMQDENGVALLVRIRTEQPYLPVVIVTAVHDLGVAIDSMRRGACDYLLKPIKREDLLSSVLRALDCRKALEESKVYQQNLEQVVQARTEMLYQAMEELEHSYDVTLEALGEALDLKDSETEGHSKRVTAYTIALARAMGIDPAQIKVIARGAFLHDIGKMAIPDQILRKPAALTPEEQAIMREHCVRGYHMLRKISVLSETAEIVYAHQEFYDGNGYPRGLRGSEIPIGARLFAVADALDAITSDRPYRKIRCFEEARTEILRCSGSQFDPQVVDVFLKMPNELWHELRLEITRQHEQSSTFEIGRLPVSPYDRKNR